MKIIGLDIGGANTDGAFIRIENDRIISSDTFREYFPMWKNNRLLEEFLEKIYDKYSADKICVSMTAELADCYESKEEGVRDISCKVVSVFGKDNVYFVTFDGLKKYDELEKDFVSAAAANWIGTTEIIKHVKSDCVFMDMGSTTTDIIPLKNKKEVATGHNDLERLISGELIYTGMLRTNLATITDYVPIRGRKCRVSSELFGITADTNMVLGNITLEEYKCSAPDGNKKDVLSCKRRIARLICADLNLLDDEEIYSIAEFIEEKQLEQIVNGLNSVISRTNLDTVIISSVSKNNLCLKAAKKVGVNILDLEKFIQPEFIKSLTAFGAIQMFLNRYYPEIIIIHRD